MEQKKLLLLGGLKYLVPVIEAAHKLGYYVITCDYIPDNIAHKYADEYYNVSIVDREAVYRLAKELNVDGIMSFAVDPGVTTAAYVCEKLGLPTPPYTSVQILQNKKLFRQFLADNGFNVPKAKGYKAIEEALRDTDYFNWPIIVKPTDSAGSKGVTKVETKEELVPALKHALKHSLSQEFIIEEFITQKGFSSDTDCFSIDSDLQLITFSNQYFDKKAANPYTPSAYTWPSYISDDVQNELISELKRLVQLLQLGTTIYNIEVREGLDGKGYIMEVAPRGGGNRLAEMIRYATGFDIIEYAVKAAVGEYLTPIKPLPYKGCWAEVVLHADKEGVFDGIEIDESVRSYLVEEDVWVKKGDRINSFKGANDTIGTLVLCFDDQDKMDQLMSKQEEWLKIVTL
jgi:biotin carboxylase